ncbi:MAG: ATP-binding protein [Actinomycetia bacterium]|nr:ATP-binding protein [Actinomycetes bacterium]
MPDVPSYDDLPDGLVVAGADGRVVVVNSAAERLTGATRQRLLGRPLAEALPLTDTRGRAWWDCIDPYGGLATRTGHPEALLRLGRHELLVTARFVRGTGRGTPVTAVVVALRGSAARDRLDRDRADLVATVAHELRSPLTSVKGFTATLLAKWDRFTDAQRRLMLETVEADADRVTRLLSELLDIARIDSGRLEVRRELVDLPAAVSRQVAGLVAAGEPAPRFVVAVEPPLPETWADADKVDQVLANLLENALRHGAGTVTVTVRAQPDGPGTEVTVTDEGEGIPAEQARRVFTRFWRGGARGGTGLGLYIVRGLVQAHGGTVTLGAAPGGGALFRVVLPPGTPPGVVAVREAGEDGPVVDEEEP